MKMMMREIASSPIPTVALAVAWFALSGPGASAVEPKPVLARDGMLEAHNRVRASVGVPPLAWSEMLAGVAQARAERQAAEGCRMQHDPEQKWYGENILWASALVYRRAGDVDASGAVRTEDVRAVQKLTAEDVVGAWAEEAEWFVAAENRCTAPAGRTCGHYTQLVWRDSREVGCGMAVCGDSGQIWVCNYKPQGNYVGRRPF